VNHFVDISAGGCLDIFCAHRYENTTQDWTEAVLYSLKVVDATTFEVFHALGFEVIVSFVYKYLCTVFEEEQDASGVAVGGLKLLRVSPTSELKSGQIWGCLLIN
jgi:hypothetical protein